MSLQQRWNEEIQQTGTDFCICLYAFIAFKILLFFYELSVHHDTVSTTTLWNAKLHFYNVSSSASWRYSIHIIYKSWPSFFSCILLALYSWDLNWNPAKYILYLVQIMTMKVFLQCDLHTGFSHCRLSNNNISFLDQNLYSIQHISKHTAKKTVLFYN